MTTYDEEEYTRRDMLKAAGGAVAGSTGLAGCTTSQSEKFDQRASAIEDRVQEGEYIDRLTGIDAERRDALWDRVHHRQATVSITDSEATVDIDTTLDPCAYVVNDTAEHDAFLDDHEPAPYMQHILEIMVDELWDLRPENRIRGANDVSDYTIRLHGVEHERSLARDYHGVMEYSTDTTNVKDRLDQEPSDRTGARLNEAAFRTNFQRRYLLQCDDRTYREVAQDYTKQLLGQD